MLLLFTRKSVTTAAPTETVAPTTTAPELGNPAKTCIYVAVAAGFCFAIDIASVSFLAFCHYFS
jgi:hypothetical protein